MTGGRADTKGSLARAALPIFALGALIYLAIWYFAPDPKVLEAERGLPWWEAVETSRGIQLWRILGFLPVSIASVVASFLALRRARKWGLSLFYLALFVTSAFFALAAAFALLTGGHAPTGMLG